MAKIPESTYIKEEKVIRVLHPANEVKLSKQSSIRFIALSLGLISPNESRTSLIDVFEILIDEHINGNGITAYEIINRLRDRNIDDKTIYYHLKRLVDYGIVSKRAGEYYLGDGFEKNFTKIVENIYKKSLNEMLSSINEIYGSLKHR